MKGLDSVLAVAQERGLIGPGERGLQIAHGEALAAIVEEHVGVPGSLVDVGSGGGLPGLVLLLRWPSCEALLVDSKQRSAEFLDWAIGELVLGQRCRVVLGRAEDLARAAELREQFELAVCRAVGSPAVSAELATGFVRVGGFVAVSEPPMGAYWDPAGLARLALDRGISISAEGSSARLCRKQQALDEQFPRRAATLTKRPLWRTEAP